MNKKFLNVAITQGDIDKANKARDEMTVDCDAFDLATICPIAQALGRQYDMRGVCVGGDSISYVQDGKTLRLNHYGNYSKDFIDLWDNENLVYPESFTFTLEN